MSVVQDILIDDALAGLRRQTASLARTGTLDEVFAAWLLPDPAEAQLDVATAASRARAQTGPMRQYRDVAILGYASAIGIDVIPNKPILEAGARWLVGRAPFAPDAVPSFEIDAIALLGIAVGVAHLSEPLAGTASSWLDGLLSRSLALPRVDAFDTLFFGASRLILSHGAGPAPDTSEAMAEVRTALRAKGVSFTTPNEADDEMSVLRRLLRPPATTPLPIRAAVVLSAATWIRRNVPTVQLPRATTEDLIRLLERVGAAMRRWTWEDKPRTAGVNSQAARWHVFNEYHVQNLLWTILAPVFPDLEDEENLPSFGQKHPRFDLGVPSLRTIVEVKFVRSGHASAFASIIGEAAEDASLYRSSNSGYDRLVLFIWDDSRTSEQHAELTQGLLKIEGIVGAVVISRPGKMMQTDVASQSQGASAQKRSVTSPSGRS